MMDNFNGGFNLMGDIFGDEFLMDTPKKEKKEKKAEKKKATKSASAKKLAKVTLPVKVFGGSFKTEIQGEGEIDTNQLAEKLIEAGYVEVANSSKAIFVPEGVNVAYVANVHSFATAADVAADFSVGEIVFAYGDEKLAMKADEFDKEEDEICVADLIDKIVECFPYHKGKFEYDVESATIVPILEPKIKGATEIPLPATFVVNGEEVVLDEETVGGKTAAEIVTHLTADFIDKDVTAFLAEKEGKYYLGLDCYKGTATTSGKKNAGAKAKKVEEKYPSDVEVFLCFNGYREKLDAGKFDGKEKITLQDIKEYLKPRFSIFSSEEKQDKIHVQFYDEKAQVINLVCEEGRRGAACAPFYVAADTDIVESSYEMDSILHKGPVTAFNKLVCCRGKYASYYNNYVFANQSMAFVYEKHPSGKNLKGFYLKIPRIPKMLREQMYDYFRSQMPNEAICKITYNHRTGGFALLKPDNMSANRIAVSSSFTMPTDVDTEVIATFHSHNSMPAFFSSTDDAAELEHIGVFGVVGQLHRETPQVLIRAVYEGGVKNVMPVDFFDAV